KEKRDSAYKSKGVKIRRMQLKTAPARRDVKDCVGRTRAIDGQELALQKLNWAGARWFWFRNFYRLIVWIRRRRASCLCGMSRRNSITLERFHFLELMFGSCGHLNI